ncbi:MAG: hypothetical protein GWN01_01400 [Nitrosopumilaceae archaeon]|nr:hypothetical protein [Nitrosopumilaceae archaeon]NIU86014.1 hypothetical protein [Nitrosopumilaceae archaeon]NIX60233.1 hypothetical protein [Nitrosopumilaceae archaeon]
MTRKEYLLKKYSDKDKKYNKLLKDKKRDKQAVKPYPLMSIKEKYLFNDIHKIGYLDIETSGLTANFDFMICYAIYVRDIDTGKHEIRGSYIKKSDLEYARRNKDADLIDKRILEKLIEDLSDLDCLIGHWFIGKYRHDIPFIRSRIAINKVSGFPKHRMVRYGDTQKWGSLIHRLSSNGLGMIGDAYGVSTKKTDIKSKTWKNACMFATRKDVKYIYVHNVKDVKITYKVHKHIEEYVPIPATYA